MATAKTVRQLLEGSLRLAGVAEAGETVESEDIAVALEVFQDILAEEAGSLFVPYVVQEAITLVVAQTTYTVGENGSPDLNTQRPEQIIGAFVRSSGGYDYPVDIIGEQQYKGIVDKDASGRPQYIWYNPTAPNGTIYTHYTPNAAESLYIDSIKTLSEPSTLTQSLLDTVGIPRNYHNPLKWMLALELCGEYGKDPTMLMVKKDDDARRKLVSLNAARSVQPVALEIGASGMSPGQGNITTF